MAHRLFCLLAVVSAAAVLVLPAEPAAQRPHAVTSPGHRHVLYAAPGDLNFSYGPRLDSPSAAPAGDHLASATITVTYSGFSTQAQAAFQAAVNIWASTISSPAPIRIRASFTPLGTGILGSAGATLACSSAAGVPNTWYPAALADKLHGSAYCAALGGETAEIDADFSSSFTNWDFGTTGVGVAGKYNFMTVVLHEIGHGLGFFGGFTSSGGIGNHFSPNPYIYDRFAVSGTGARLLSFGRGTTALHAQLTGNNTFTDGANSISRNGGLTPKLETHHMTNQYGASSDNGWLQGSSYSHLDDVLYSGTPNGLMTWRLNSNEVYSDVGPIVKGMFEDQGWTIAGGLPDAPVLVAPTGTIVSTSPNFVWNVVAGAQTYRLYLIESGSASPRIDGTYAAATYCSGATCTVATPSPLTPGRSYEWRVYATNSAGNGPTSSATFAVQSAVPGQPVLTSPSGSIPTITPTFAWTGVANAQVYELTITPQGSATPVAIMAYASATACSGLTCSRPSPVTLQNSRTYQWTVRAANEYGPGPSATAFTFTTPAPLPAPAFLTVTPGVGGQRLLWAAVPGASSYTVRRIASTGTSILASGLATTIHLDTTPATGVQYTVAAVNAGGEGQQSQPIHVPWGAAGSRTPTTLVPQDYDGDGKTDVTVYRGASGEWFTLQSATESLASRSWGAPSLQDQPVPADYDGDGKADRAVYRGTTGEWFILRSTDGATTYVPWGSPALGDVPVPADYDGDGRTDIAVYRSSTGAWIVFRSTAGVMTTTWGAAAFGDLPVPADYDGDGKADIAIYRGTTGEWFVLRSVNGALFTMTWGAASLGDVPVPADYDGDGRADVAVYRSTTGQWFLSRSSAGTLQVQWGSPGNADVPVSADYDGDGKADIGVYRYATGEWFVMRSSDGSLLQRTWGSPTVADTARPF